MEVKICTKCNESKNINEFNKNINAKDGRAYWCRSCFKEYTVVNKKRIKRTKENYKDKAAANSRKHYLRNKENIKFNNKSYYEKNKEQINLGRKIYYNKNKEKIKSNSKKYYIKAKLRAWKQTENS